MKIWIIFLISIFSIGLISNIDADYASPKEDPSLPEITMQLAVWDSNGNLVTYIEPTLFFIQNLYLTHEFLDTIENRQIITKDEINYELIQLERTDYYSQGLEGQITAYCLYHEDECVLLFSHDGYFIEPGDSLEIAWKFLRTV